MTTEGAEIHLDQPLTVGSAIEHDKLSRKSFAHAVVASLRKVSSASGLVLSVEGAWGSGKTSTLAMIEEILSSEPIQPVVVHFNPWLVGDRDALLGQFLSKLASALELADHANDGKKVAKEIKAYSRAFDVLKLIPGAEPWASMIKAVLVSVGEAASDIAEHKSKDLEQHKTHVQDALRSYSKPIIVFIDDIDRLFPLEVFEMIRIVKAVGELPQVGYILAWDPAYVTQALASANIPQADSYLDKIVQVRMPLPSLSLSAKGRLINDALAAMEPAAMEEYFANSADRLSQLYFSGLRDLLAQPRDVARVFNSVAIIEPALRGEVVFSDIVGLAALMVKAPSVFELLRQHPKWFVGRMPQDNSVEDKSEHIIKEGAPEREAALAVCAQPEAIKRVVHRLFPQIAKADDQFTRNSIVDIEGHIAHPARLLIALQLSISLGDISLVSARRFVSNPGQRDEISAALIPETSFEFLEAVGDMAGSIGHRGISDLEDFCLAVAKLADAPPLVKRAKDRSGGFGLHAEAVAIRAIQEAVKAVDTTVGPSVALQIVRSGQALTVSAELLAGTYESDHPKQELLTCPADEVAKTELLAQHHTWILAAVRAGTFFDVANPGYILWMQARSSPNDCNGLFEAIKAFDPSLDAFALAFLNHSFDSVKGQTFSLPREANMLEVFCSVDDLKAHAATRLADQSLAYPVKAAWRAVAEGKKLYAIDGTESRH